MSTKHGNSWTYTFNNFIYVQNLKKDGKNAEKSHFFWTWGGDLYVYVQNILSEDGSVIVII